MFRTKVAEKLEVHILCLVTLFENGAVYEITWKNSVEWGQATDSTVHAHCMLNI
jgi:hypothetical protein